MSAERKPLCLTLTIDPWPSTARSQQHIALHARPTPPNSWSQTASQLSVV